MWLNTNCVRSDIEALNIRCYFHKCYVIVCVCVLFSNRVAVVELFISNRSLSLLISPIVFSSSSHQRLSAACWSLPSRLPAPPNPAAVRPVTSADGCAAKPPAWRTVFFLDGEQATITRLNQILVLFLFFFPLLILKTEQQKYQDITTYTDPSLPFIITHSCLTVLL